MFEPRPGRTPCVTLIVITAAFRSGARSLLQLPLVLGGPRVKELCWSDGHDVDPRARRLRVPRIATKHRADRAYGPQEPVFATRNGTRNTQNDILSRIVVPVRGRA